MLNIKKKIPHLSDRAGSAIAHCYAFVDLSRKYHNTLPSQTFENFCLLLTAIVPLYLSQEGTLECHFRMSHFPK